MHPKGTFKAFNENVLHQEPITCYYQLLPRLHLETCINALFTCIRLKPSANGRNVVSHATTPNIVGSCCVRLHVAKSLTGF